MTELDKANQRIAELEAELAAIGAGGVNGPLMTPAPTSGAADLSAIISVCNNARQVTRRDIQRCT